MAILGPAAGCGVGATTLVMLADPDYLAVRVSVPSNSKTPDPAPGRAEKRMTLCPGLSP